MDMNYHSGALNRAESDRVDQYNSDASVIASVDDYATCHIIMRNASKNYSFASRYLPKEKQAYVEALYALMRVGDDRVDVSNTGFLSRQAAIDDWEKSYWQAFTMGDSSHPVLRAYLDTANKFSIPAELMVPYFRAMREDLSVKRYSTFMDLYHYMEGSALPVGRAMTYILGVKPGYSIEQAIQYADALSVAMQLSNFWRDIGEDWQRGRVYLPLEDIQKFGYSEVDLSNRLINNHWINLMEFEFERTECYYAQARQGISMLASGNWAVYSALEIYAAIINSIRSQGYDIFNKRAGTNQFHKLRLVMKSYWYTRRQETGNK